MQPDLGKVKFVISFYETKLWPKITYTYDFLLLFILYIGGNEYTLFNSEYCNRNSYHNSNPV